ncbi:MAG: hypothetical protein P8I93_02625 [Crocinitomicaceae bacterium]|nr:hypothetical protein [Crocinitomicaceae bacterium]
MFIELSKVNILNYLNKINNSQKPLWGNMSSQRMIEHLSDIVVISRSLNYKYPLQINPEKIELAQGFIYSDKSLPKNFKVSFASDEKRIRNKNISQAIIEFESEWDQYLKFFKSNPNVKTVHPYFGKLDFELWNRLHAKHFTHHFIQFDLL